MNKKHLQIVAAAAVSLFASSASAAELGSFLTRLEGGYSMSKSSIDSSGDQSFNSTIKTKKLNGYNFGVGFGYVASDNIWTDVTASFANAKTKESSTANRIEDTNITAMLNGYYGFNMGNKFSPYVMLGFGGGLAKTKLTPPTTGLSINNTVINGKDSKPLTSQLTSKNTAYFAYQAGFGLSVAAMDSVSFDIGYRIGNHKGGKFNNIDTSGKTLTLKPNSTIKQSVVLGLNIAF